jgi:hypothetical protein
MLVVVAGVLAGSAVSAQGRLPNPTAEKTALAAQSRVRVQTTSPGGRPIVGTVISMDAETLVVTDETLGTTRRIPTGGIARLEKLTARRFGFGRGVGYGLLIGVGAGAAWGAATYSPCRSTGFNFSCIMTPTSRSQSAVWNAAGLGVAGVIVGGIVGLAASKDTWVDITMSPRARVVIVPASNGLALSVRVGF